MRVLVNILIEVHRELTFYVRACYRLVDQVLNRREPSRQPIDLLEVPRNYFLTPQIAHVPSSFSHDKSAKYIDRAGWRDHAVLGFSTSVEYGNFVVQAQSGWVRIHGSVLVMKLDRRVESFHNP